MSQEDAWNETTIQLSKATEVIFNYSNLTRDIYLYSIQKEYTVGGQLLRIEAWFH